jgi:hypothetical protein
MKKTTAVKKDKKLGVELYEQLKSETSPILDEWKMMCEVLKAKSVEDRISRENLNNFMKKNKPKGNPIKAEGTPVYAVMKVAVFPKGTGLYSDQLTEVEFIDEGGNGYIQIIQEDRFININFEEWPALRSAIELTLNGADKFLPNDAF